MKVNWDSILVRALLLSGIFTLISLGFMALNLPRDMRQGIFPYIDAMGAMIDKSNKRKITHNLELNRNIDREIKEGQLRGMYQIHKRALENHQQDTKNHR